MMGFGEPNQDWPRWMLAVVVVAAFVGVVVGIWVFGALT